MEIYKDCKELDNELITPKGSTLRVVGHNRLKGGDRRLYVTCSACKEDEELYPKEFLYRPNSFRNGIISCGCSKSPRRSEEQHRILVERRCKELGYNFYGFVGVYDKLKTLLDLENPKTNNRWCTTKAGQFLTYKTKDPVAGFQENRKALEASRRKSDKEHIQGFLATGAFLEGTVFKRNSVRLDSRGHNSFWDITCPVCSYDEYVSSGNCTGVFTGITCDLKTGHLSCRCSKSYRWTEQQRVYKLEMVCKYEGAVFNGLSEEYRGTSTNFDWVCSNGHDQVNNISSFLLQDQRCSTCTNTNLNQYYSYLSYLEDCSVKVGLKFGITASYINRVKNQARYSRYDITPYKLFRYPSVSSCKAAEKEVKMVIPRSVVTKKDMPDGYSETVKLCYEDEIIQIYNKYGGVEVNINDNLLTNPPTKIEEEK